MSPGPWCGSTSCPWHLYATARCPHLDQPPATIRPKVHATPEGLVFTLEPAPGVPPVRWDQVWAGAWTSAGCALVSWACGWPMGLDQVISPGAAVYVWLASLLPVIGLVLSRRGQAPR